MTQTNELVAARSAVIPTLRYKDSVQAVEWLCSAFGFERHRVVEEDGKVIHAQLTHDGGMIMLGHVRDDNFSHSLGQPSAERPGTQCPYVVVQDIDSHYERAKAAGADIVMPLEAQHYGGKNYAARDPEGHLWSFGDYDPWAPDPQGT